MGCADQSLGRAAGTFEHVPCKKEAYAHSLIRFSPQFFAILGRTLEHRVTGIGGFRQDMEWVLRETPLAPHGKRANQRMGLRRARHIRDSFHIALPGKNPDIADEKRRDVDPVFARFESQPIGTADRNGRESDGEFTARDFAHRTLFPALQGGVSFEKSGLDRTVFAACSVDDDGGSLGAETLHDLAACEAGKNIH